MIFNINELLMINVWNRDPLKSINILCVHQLEMLFKAAEVFISVLFISETETFLLEI